MSLRMLAIVGVALALTACVQENLGGTAPLPVAGSKHSDVIKVGRITFPLPEGEWVVMASGTSRSNMVDGSVPTTIDKVVLGRRGGAGSSSMIAGIVSLEANRDTQNVRWLRDRTCFQEDWMSVSNYFGSEAEQNCLRVAVWNTNFQYNSNWHPVERQAVDWARANGISLAPTTFLGARYRIVRRTDLATAFYYRTNDDLGVNLGNWWHPIERQQRPPFEKAYQDFLVWAKSWEARVIAGAEGRLSTAPVAAPVVSPPNVPAVAAPQDRSARLRELEKLRSEGLISQEEFSTRRQRILDGI
jgi:hypothetical protein